MSTRGLVGFVLDGENIGVYNHYDSYPEGLGEIVVKFVSENNMEEFRKRLKAVDFTGGDCLFDVLDDSRDDLLPEILNGNLTGKYENEWDFLNDSLFCEYAYILNLDEMELWFLVGFQKQKDPDNPIGTEPRGGYYPCRVIKRVPFGEIPDDWKEQYY